MKASQRERQRIGALRNMYARAYRPDRIFPPKPQPERALPPGYQYNGLAGHRSARRLLRQRLALCLEKAAVDQAAAAARDRLLLSVCDEPNPYYQLAHLAHVALLAAEETGTKWAESVNVMLDKFEAQAAEAAPAQAS